MKTPSIFLSLVLAAVLPAAAADYKPELFKTTKLVYSDNFDSGAINAEFWEVRQNTTWAIKDGILHGSPSSKEFQDKKKDYETLQRKLKL